MDGVTVAEEIEQEIQTVMREQGVDRIEAETIVGLRRGELFGDILVLHPLTDEQRRELRLGRSIDDVLAAERALHEEEHRSRATNRMP